MDAQLSLKSNFAIEGTLLVLRYEVENRSNRDAYLFARVDLGQPYTGDSNVVYVHFERDSKTVWLNKMIPAIPKGLHPYDVACPYQVPVRAGTTFAEEVHIPLPVEERRAYPERAGRAPGEAQRVTYTGVRFTLQYYWRTEGMTEEFIDVGELKALVTRGGQLKESDFGLLESERVKLQIPTLESP